jgi:hypothetical protein
LRCWQIVEQVKASLWGAPANNGSQVVNLKPAQKDKFTIWINDYLWKSNKVLLPKNGSWQQQPGFEELMFQKIEVKDVASRVLLRDECYKFLNRAINQKRANAKFAVYKKYLSKKMWNDVELHAANSILLTTM